MIKKLNRSVAQQPLRHPVKILQFGTGNFLRAFSDWIIDIANEENQLNGSVCITQVNSPKTDSRFIDQEGLYHVVVNGMRNGELVREARLITCVAPATLNPAGDYEKYLQAGENPDLLYIISNTTEAGIRVDPADESLNQPASTFPGKLTALLYRRYQHFKGDPGKGLVFLPCELIEQNGEALKQAILQYAELWKIEPDFSSWIRDSNLFCDSLVDRIVPGFPQDERDNWWNETGYEDNLLVAAEPYHLWLIQIGSGPERLAAQLRSDFTPPGDRYNLHFVDDLAPYRERKVRILNGAHTTMVPVAYLRGFRTVRESITDPTIGEFVRGALTEEILPTLDMPQPDLEQFAADVIERFQNPFIHHELKSIALNSIAKFRVRVLPSLLEYHIRKGALPMRLVESLAAWIVFYRGEWKGESLPVNDAEDVMSFFLTAWKEKDADTVTSRVLAHPSLWGQDLTAISGLSSAVAREVEKLIQSGD